MDSSEWQQETLWSLQASQRNYLNITLTSEQIRREGSGLATTLRRSCRSLNSCHLELPLSQSQPCQRLSQPVVPLRSSVQTQILNITCRVTACRLQRRYLHVNICVTGSLTLRECFDNVLKLGRSSRVVSLHRETRPLNSLKSQSH